MKILQVIDSLQIGGAEVLLRHLVPLFIEEGHDVDIYLLQSTNSSLERELLKEGISIYSPNNSTVYSISHIFSLAQYLREKIYDVIHVHLFPAQLWVAIANKLVHKKTSLVTTEHNTYNRRRKKLYRPLDQWMYRQYNTIAAISDATANELYQWCPELESKVTLVPNGIQIEKFKKALPVPKVKITGYSEAPVIIFVGRFDEQKDHITLIKAMVNIPDAHLVLVGDGPLRKEMELLASKLAIDNRVHFLGRRNDVHELIKMADIYVQSSHWEGFGIAVVEAMAGGLPVIASKVPGLCDVVGNSGILFEPRNSKQLARYIKAVIDNKELYNSLSINSSARAEQFNIEVTAKKYIDLYRSPVM